MFRLQSVPTDSKSKRTHFLQALLDIIFIVVVIVNMGACKLRIKALAAHLVKSDLLFLLQARVVGKMQATVQSGTSTRYVSQNKQVALQFYLGVGGQHRIFANQPTCEKAPRTVFPLRPQRRTGLRSS